MPRGQQPCRGVWNAMFNHRGTLTPAYSWQKEVPDEVIALLIELKIFRSSAWKHTTLRADMFVEAALWIRAPPQLNHRRTKVLVEDRAHQGTGCGCHSTLGLVVWWGKGKKEKDREKGESCAKPGRKDTRGHIKPFVSLIGGSLCHRLYPAPYPSLVTFTLFTSTPLSHHKPQILNLYWVCLPNSESHTMSNMLEREKKMFFWMCFLKPLEGHACLEVANSPVASEGPQQGWHPQASLRDDRLHPTASGYWMRLSPF